ncbi:Nucleotide-sugar transporter [Corchorus capsularis]|uniref:Nucleotide-sugar transporter n=1 Tax=Corchorus capsularis TaxID=210143 RepID=A0A1R3H1Z5_COCAP|nr:Nucleotide-sugar transporter [Corchorus capsularis]
MKMKWYFVATLLTVLTSSQGILTTLSQSNGKYKYDYATVPFLAEVFKLIVSSVFLWREFKKSPPPKMTTDWKSVRLFPIPSVIYLIHNNVQFATLMYVDTSTYQIMGNLKIVTTAILFRLFLSKKLSNLQWMAIVLLAVGTTTSQVKGCGEASCDSLFSAPIQGYMLGILSACLSALAGVYTEFLMKKNNDSLYWQNVQLYTFGAIFNMARLLLDDFRGGFEKGPWWQRLFDGYTVTTWMVILNLGSTGLLVSWLMKYADNIVKVYSTSMAMLLTMVLSVFLFNFKPTVQLFLGIIVCMMSLHMYFAPPHMLVDLPSTVRSDPESLVNVPVDPEHITLKDITTNKIKWLWLMTCYFSSSSVHNTVTGGRHNESFQAVARLGNGPNGEVQARNWCGHFQMPLHYPRYTKADYDAMPEWKIDCLLKEYGLPITGDVEQKRKFAMGAFLWPR